MESRNLTSQIQKAAQTGLLELTSDDFLQINLDINHQLHTDNLQNLLTNASTQLKTLVLRNTTSAQLKFIMDLLNFNSRNRTIINACFDRVEFAKIDDVKRLFGICGSNLTTIACFDLTEAAINFVCNAVQHRKNGQFSIFNNNFTTKHINPLINKNITVNQVDKDHYIHKVLGLPAPTTHITIPTLMNPLPAPAAQMSSFLQSGNSMFAYPHPLLAQTNLPNPFLIPTPHSQSIVTTTIPSSTSFQGETTSTTSTTSDSARNKKKRKAPAGSSGKMTLTKLHERVEQMEENMHDRFQAIEDEMGILKQMIGTLESKIITSILQTQTDHKFEQHMPMINSPRNMLPVIPVPFSPFATSHSIGNNGQIGQMGQYLPTNFYSQNQTLFSPDIGQMQRTLLSDPPFTSLQSPLPSVASSNSNNTPPQQGTSLKRH